ncbi:hypothetical protein V6N13_060479 [Hibiscus sabdariffa]
MISIEKKSVGMEARLESISDHCQPLVIVGDDLEPLGCFWQPILHFWCIGYWYARKRIGTAMLPLRTVGLALLVSVRSLPVSVRNATRIGMTVYSYRYAPASI